MISWFIFVTILAHFFFCLAFPAILSVVVLKWSCTCLSRLSWRPVIVRCCFVDPHWSRCGVSSCTICQSAYILMPVFKSSMHAEINKTRNHISTTLWCEGMSFQTGLSCSMFWRQFLAVNLRLILHISSRWLSLASLSLSGPPCAVVIFLSLWHDSIHWHRTNLLIPHEEIYISRH